MHPDSEQLAALVRIPDLDASVLAGRGDGTAVGAEGYALDAPLVSRHLQNLFARDRVPNLDLTRGVVLKVSGGRGQEAAVRAERDALDVVLVSGERDDLATGRQVPELDGSVIA